MNEDRNLSYKQRYGFEDLPQPMKLGVLSDDIRREISNLVWRLFDEYPYTSFRDNSKIMIQQVVGKYQKVRWILIRARMNNYFKI